MFKNVIVGVDGKEGGRDAIALATVLRGEGGTLTLTYIYPMEPRPWRGASPAYDAAEHQDAIELLQRVETEAGTEARVRAYGTMSVGRGLHELAEELGADLLVVGSSRRGLLGRVLIGDDTRTALNGAPCAVAIAPAGYSLHPSEMREIGVGYDGSAESGHALGVARELAKAHHAELSALEAIFFPARLAAGPPLPDRATIKEMLDAAQERLADLDEVEPHVVYGEPAEELASYSASLDLLVIGSRSYGPFGRLVHGSTAQRLASSARSPLLVLTRAARQVKPRMPSENERVMATASGTG
jgi:nucleotide-binding universal stress UspA family protein